MQEGHWTEGKKKDKKKKKPTKNASRIRKVKNDHPILVAKISSNLPLEKVQFTVRKKYTWQGFTKFTRRAEAV